MTKVLETADWASMLMTVNETNYQSEQKVVLITVYLKMLVTKKEADVWCYERFVSTYRFVFLITVWNCLSFFWHDILGRQTLSSGMISSGYLVEKGITPRKFSAEVAQTKKPYSKTRLC